MLFLSPSCWREEEGANSGPWVSPSRTRPRSRRCALNATTVAGLTGDGALPIPRSRHLQMPYSLPIVA